MNEYSPLFVYQFFLFLLYMSASWLCKHPWLAGEAFFGLPSLICAYTDHLLSPRLPAQVIDLHSVSPATFLDVCGGSVHALSYQQARNNRTAVGQVYVAEPGYVLGKANIPKYAIITSLAATKTPNLAALANVLRSLKHGVRVPIEYFTFSARNRTKTSLLQVDMQWYGPPKMWTRVRPTGARRWYALSYAMPILCHL